MGMRSGAPDASPPAPMPSLSPPMPSLLPVPPSPPSPKYLTEDEAAQIYVPRAEYNLTITTMERDITQLQQLVQLLQDAVRRLTTPPPPSPPPSPPPPSPPPPALKPIPDGGVQVIHGRSGQQLACLMPGRDEGNTTVGEQTIAAQCCSKNGEGNAKCRRSVNSECIAGRATRTVPPTPFTYSDMAAACERLSTPDDPLEPCDQSCSGTGCGYNTWPVYTKIPC